jgi:hypothetical protein
MPGLRKDFLTIPLAIENEQNKRLKTSGACMVVALIALTTMLLICGGVAVAFEMLPWQALHIETLSVGVPVCGQWEARTERVNGEGLRAVAVVSSTDIWAVGGRSEGALVQHWDGNTWRTVDAPSLPRQDDVVLRSIAAVSASDIWATGDNRTHSFTLHWDGTGWKLVPNPNTGKFSNRLYSIAALSSNNVWAVGEYQLESDNCNCNAGSRHVLILHWDGSQWNQVTDLNSEITDASLQALTVVAPNDIWAVGSSGGDALDPLRTLTLHWNGTRWSMVPSSGPGKASNELRGVAAISKDDIWAVGEYKDEPGTTSGASMLLLLHWDGKRWAQALGPQLTSDNDNKLSGITALSKDDVWAVGGYNKTANLKYESLMLHWDGAHWSVVPSPQPKYHQYLRAVAVVSPDTLLAVGGASNDDCDSAVCPPIYTFLARFTRASCSTITPMAR